MSMTDAPLREEPIFFDAAGEQLFGIWTAPAGGESRTGVIVLGGGKTASTVTGRNAIFATIARTAAGLGFPALRFDYHGIGDSTGEARQSQDEPPVGDLVGAVAFLRERGPERWLMVGSCYGGRTALSGASRIGDVGGIVMLSPSLRDYASSERKTEGWSVSDYARAIVRPRTLLGGTEPITTRRYLRFLRTGARVAARRARVKLTDRRDPTPWVSGAFLGSLAAAIDAGIPILLLYGDRDENLEDFRAAQAGRLAMLLRGAGAQVEVVVIPGRVHGFATIEVQERVAELVAERLTAWREPV